MAAHHPKRRPDQTIEYDGDRLVAEVWQMPWSTMDDHDPVGVAQLGPTLSVIVRQRGGKGPWRSLKTLHTATSPDQLAKPREAALDPRPGDRVEYYGDDGCRVVDIQEVLPDGVVVRERMYGGTASARTLSMSELQDGLRWEVETFFKTAKSGCALSEQPSRSRHRVETLVYAALLRATLAMRAKARVLRLVPARNRVRINPHQWMRWWNRQLHGFLAELVGGDAPLDMDTLLLTLADPNRSRVPTRDSFAEVG